MKSYELTLKIYSEEMEIAFNKKYTESCNRYYGKIKGYIQCLEDLSVIDYTESLQLKEKYLK